MLKRYPHSLNTRFKTGLNFKKTLTAGTTPHEPALSALPKVSGRDSSGHVSSRHRGGREKRQYRLIDFRRDKYDVQGTVLTIEYDPNRNSNISLIGYPDGDKRYIIHPEGLAVGDKVLSKKSEIEARNGNAMPLGIIPVGTVVHNIELKPGAGGVIVRGAGTGAIILAKEGDYVTIKLPSGETRLVNVECFATVGTVDNSDWKNVVMGKAGRNRHRGIRPRVRGTAQNPRTHPHGGGEGRSGVGLKQPKTPWGKPARGKITRSRKRYSNKYILSRKKR